MVKHLSQSKKKKTNKAQKIVLSSESTEEDEHVPETPYVTSILRSSIPETTVIFTAEVSIPKSLVEEVRTSGLGENVSKDAAQGPFISTPFETFVSVPPTSTIPPTSTTISPTFEHILNHTITSMFSSQSTDTPKPTSPTETDHEGFGGTFEDLEFQDDKEDFPDHMIMTIKQYKILNQKLNSIIQSQADLGGGSSISSLEVDSMLKVCESRIITKVSGMLKASETVLMEKVDYSDQTTELCLKNQRSDFLGEVKEGVMKLLQELKEISTKLASSPLITSEFFSQKVVQFEAILNKQLAPPFRIFSLLPTTIAPPVFTGVQGGERKSIEEEMKVVGKVPYLGGMFQVLVEEAHKSRFSIHPGATKMYRDLRLDYWWPCMKRDVAWYVERCLTCRKVTAEH
ncbi:unnamed protein product [Lactuca saligna]|uniref:Integrase zinc-binding domain-containing protein n=1 Tax=Lactuca saligna TaxID=75948 RepID=A0AA36ENG1_LACSI|nr:unnamed protein product [Lactuca saligna]